MVAARSFPVTPGHFPGNPVVPGALLLQWLAEVGVIGFQRVRFLAVVRPGEEVTLRTGAPHDGLLHFSVWRRDVEVARGIGRMARSAG